MGNFWQFVAHLKDIATILTPIIVALFGIYLNKIIQNQNKIAERRSALSKQWADEFSALAAEIYDVSVQFILLYFKAVHIKVYVATPEEEFWAEMELKQRMIAFQIEEQRLRMDKYIDLAPSTGPALQAALKVLHDEIRKWLKQKGGDSDQLRALQFDFNQHSRKTHREILELES